jgi:preprotein translocase subunit SecA
MEEQWDIVGLEDSLEREFAQRLPIKQWLESDNTLHEETLRARILSVLEQIYADKEKVAGSPVMRHFEKAVMLQVLDGHWKDHLAAMDYLRQGIHLRGYAQKNPKQEYKREAYELFTEMLERIKGEVIGLLSKVQVRAEADVEKVEEQRRHQVPMNFQHAEASPLAASEEEAAQPVAAEEHGEAAKAQPFVRTGRKVGRNEPCPCGSGKKYKQCHGKLEH